MKADNTAHRIAYAALTLFLERGVKKTNLQEVARRAGLTRVTVYRYFGDKRGLVREICKRISGVFVRAAEGSSGDTIQQVNDRLNRLGMELSTLPQGNLLARLEEISYLYPDVYEKFRRTRQEAVDALFHQALTAATRSGEAREGLNLEVLKAIFWSSVIGLLETPALISSNVPLAEIFETVTEVFRHGILKRGVGDGGQGELSNHVAN